MNEIELFMLVGSVGYLIAGYSLTKPKIMTWDGKPLNALIRLVLAVLWGLWTPPLLIWCLYKGYFHWE